MPNRFTVQPWFAVHGGSSVGGAAVKIIIFRGLRATGETGQGISGT